MRQRGFSIIEIAVVLVVLALILTSSMPSIGSWLRNIRLRNQAEALQNGLQQARNEAVRRNRTVGFYMVNAGSATALTSACAQSASGTSWVVSARDPAGACNAQPTDTPTSSTDPMIVATHVGADGGSGVRVSGLETDGSTAASSVSFDAFGRRTGDLARITVDYAVSQSGDRPLQIDVSANGMVRMCDPNANDDDPRRCP
jgi:type IV fimbrial biogenesis protein FimT